MFARTRAEGRPAVILFVPAGWPELYATVDIVQAAVEAGADAIELGSGFIYCVSVVGITGERPELSAELPEFIGRVRARTELPLAIGFGISTREHVEASGALADAVVIGSAFVRTIAAAPAHQRLD